MTASRYSRRKIEQECWRCIIVFISCVLVTAAVAVTLLELWR